MLIRGKTVVIGACSNHAATCRLSINARLAKALTRQVFLIG